MSGIDNKSAPIIPNPAATSTGTSGVGPSGSGASTTTVTSKVLNKPGDAQRAAQQAGFEKSVGTAEQSARTGIASNVPIPLPYDETSGDAGSAPQSRDLKHAQEGLTMTASRLEGIGHDVKGGQSFGKAALHAAHSANDMTALEGLANSKDQAPSTKRAQHSLDKMFGIKLDDQTPPGHALAMIAAHVAGHHHLPAGSAESHVAASAFAITEGARGALNDAEKASSRIGVHRSAQQTLIPKRNMGA